MRRAQAVWSESAAPSGRQTKMRRRLGVSSTGGPPLAANGPVTVTLPRYGCTRVSPPVMLVYGRRYGWRSVSG